MTIILKPFAILLTWLINLCNSYGLALILFTIIIKVILFPFNLKSKRSMIKTSALQEQVQRIQKQYAKNPDKMNQAISELYAREKASPMSGCIWSLIPLPILLGLYSIIRQPLTYMMSLAADQVTAVRTALEGMGLVFEEGAYIQLHMAEALSRSLGSVQAAVPEVADKLFAINFDFLGINMAQVPNFRFWEAGSFSWAYIGLFLIPVVSAITGFISSWYSMKVNNMQSNAQGGAMNNMMLIYMPIMSLIIGFIMPAGLGIYWIANNVLTLLSEMIFKVILKKEYAKAAIEREERAIREKEEEARRKEQEREERARRIEAEKEARKNRARKKTKAARNPNTNNSGASRVGIRAYARGRNYDPNRFSPEGPTLYRDPSAVVDEEAIERAVEEKEIQAEVEAALKRGQETAAAEEETSPALDAPAGEPSADEAPEVPTQEEDTPSAEFPKTLFDEKDGEEKENQ